MSLSRRRAAANRALSATTKPPWRQRRLLSSAAGLQRNAPWRQRRKLAPRRPRTPCARCSVRPAGSFGTRRTRFRMTASAEGAASSAPTDSRRRTGGSFGAKAASREARDAEDAPQDDKDGAGVNSSTACRFLGCGRCVPGFCVRRRG
jgi:hypothetical protein